MKQTKQTPAAIVRAALKNELGLNIKQVSCRMGSGGGCINVEVKDPTANLEAVKEIAKRQEKLDRCEYTYEVLSGGNTFVFVSWSSSALTERGAPYVEKVAEVIAQLEAEGLGATQSYLVAEGVWLGRSGYQARLSTDVGMIIVGSFDALSVAPRVQSSLDEIAAAKK